MKILRLYTLLSFIAAISMAPALVNAQTNIPNGDFEAWRGILRPGEYIPITATLLTGIHLIRY